MKLTLQSNRSVSLLSLSYFTGICLSLSCLSLSIGTFTPTYAQSGNQSSEINRVEALEDQILLAKFPQDSLEARLSRLENTVFGQDKPGTAEVRLRVLEKTLKPYQETTPTQTNNASQSSSLAPERDQSNNNDSETSDATDYPTVVSLERVIFARDFIHDSLPVRLNRMESKAFGRTFSDLPLADRVDNLLARFPEANYSSIPDSHEVKPAYKPSSLAKTSPALRPNPSNAALSSDLYTKLNLLENKILGTEVNQEGKLLSERLDILEKKVYGYSQHGNFQERVNRLMVTRPASSNHIASQSTSQYRQPFNQLSQPINQPKNIQIGMGVTSQSQYQYSPELLNMLPNDVRQRVQQGNTVSSGNGNVTMTETTTTPSGFYTLPNGAQVYQPSMQYQQTYQMTPTIIAPGSGSNQSTLPAPEVLTPQSTMIQVQPQMLQQLDQLEMKVFNHVNQTDSPEMRLWKLETQLTSGKSTYGGYPLDTRIENAWKLYQYQFLGTILQSPGANSTPIAR